MKQTREKANIRSKTGRSWFFPLLVVLVLLSFSMELLGGNCAISSVVGFPCPGCGSTRAAVLLFQGRLNEALRMHPLIILSLFMLVVVLATELLKYVRKKQGKEWHKVIPQRIQDILVAAIIVLYLGVYIYRMIKYYPHTEPMVYNWNSVWGQIARLAMRLFA